MNDSSSPNPGPSRWALPPLCVGEFAPHFVTASRSNPKFHFSTMAGRYVLLAFMPRDPAARAAALAAFQGVRSLCDDRRMCAFLLLGGTQKKFLRSRSPWN